MSRVSPVAPYPIQSSIETLHEDHVIQRLLCDDLERVADCLPALPALPELRRISDRILRITSSHFARAEQILRTMPPEQRPTPVMLDALHQMHVLDELHGQDLIVTLWQHVGTAAGANIGQLSYMLRCFFDGCRRAIRLKESYIANAGAGVVRPD
ncbi:hypothetical protein [Sphingomonas sp.]|uniref:hypothetical protein n=1 Tax=Sphingomonas sp. TaxID=28214 RepID=UPI003340DCDA